jgi:hypothetical protein
LNRSGGGLCLFVAGSSGGGFLRLSHLWREFQELEMATGWFLYSNFHVLFFFTKIDEVIINVHVLFDV